MAGKSNIEWTEATWNPIVGCSILSPGCTNCYAMKMAARIEAMRQVPNAHPTHYAGTTKKVKGNAVWTGKLALAPDNILLAPLRRKKPTTYFVNSMGDLFHEDAPDEWIDKVFAVMALTPQHTYQVLTKRAERMRAYVAQFEQRGQYVHSRTRGQVSNDPRDGSKFLLLAEDQLWPLPNVWLGVSTERQQEADERIPLLLQTPAAVRFISAEPLLGPIDLTALRPDGGNVEIDALNGLALMAGRPSSAILAPTKLDWVIVGGESGPNARPMHRDWARSLRDQCADAGVPFFFKQWGEWGPENWDGKDNTRGGWLSPDGTLLDDVLDIQTSKAAKPFSLIFRHGKKAAGRLLDSREHNDMPKVRG